MFFVGRDSAAANDAEGRRGAKEEGELVWEMLPRIAL